MDFYLKGGISSPRTPFGYVWVCMCVAVYMYVCVYIRNYECLCACACVSMCVKMCVLLEYLNGDLYNKFKGSNYQNY